LKFCDPEPLLKNEYEIQEKEDFRRIDSGIITKPGCDCKKVLINESFL